MITAFERIDHGFSAQHAYQLRHAQSSDVDEHAHNLSKWEQSYDQIAPGRFVGSLSEFWTPEAQIFLERTSHKVRQRCQVWDDALWFGLSTRHDGTRLDGREAPQDAVFVRPGGEQFELLTPSHHEIFGVVVRRSAMKCFCDQARIEAAWQRLTHASWITLNSALRHRSAHTLGTIFDQLSTSGRPPPHPAQCKTLSEAVLSIVLPFVEAPVEEEPANRAFSRRKKVVDQITEYVTTHPNWVPTVPELCERFHLSRRSLQYAFEHTLGISPQAYLRRTRLNGVRRMLRDSHTGPDVHVQEVAAKWGFWNLSQFSQDYRKLFGERPSDTLRAVRADSFHY